MNHTCLYQTEHLCKQFEDLEALSDISLQLFEGTVLGLLGSNGAGKSTLLNILSGVLRQDEGQVAYAGAPVYENPQAKEQILMVPDDPYLYAHDTLMQMAETYRAAYPAWSKEHLDKYTKILELPLDRHLGDMSRGTRRRAALVLALAARPRLLLLDEVFDGLDPVMRERAKRILMAEAAEGMAVVIATHNLRELEEVADHVALLHKGALVLTRDLESLREEMHLVQCAFQGDIPRQQLEDLNPLRLDVRGRLCTLVLRGRGEEADAAIEALAPVFWERMPLSLEEIFLAELRQVGYDIGEVSYD